MKKHLIIRGASSTQETSKMESFESVINGFQSLINVTKDSILDVAGVLDMSLKL